MRWAGHVTRMGAKMNAYRILVGKPEGKRSLGRPRRRWVDNIKIDKKRNEIKRKKNREWKKNKDNKR
jgi:hypothetical protein